MPRKTSYILLALLITITAIAYAIASCGGGDDDDDSADGGNEDIVVPDDSDDDDVETDDDDTATDEFVYTPCSDDAGFCCDSFFNCRIERADCLGGCLDEECIRACYADHDGCLPDEGCGRSELDCRDKCRTEFASEESARQGCYDDCVEKLIPCLDEECAETGGLDGTTFAGCLETEVECATACDTPVCEATCESGFNDCFSDLV